MAPLPNADRAILDIRKLENYCLDPMHPRGRHKARVFREALGVTRQDAHWLRDILLNGLASVEAVEVGTDRFGARFRVDVPVTRQGRRFVIRTVWMMRKNEPEPRFLTCWIV